MDAAGHASELFGPHGVPEGFAPINDKGKAVQVQGEEVQFGVVEHRSGYSGPMTRRRRVIDPDDYFDLGENVCGGGGVGDNEVDGPHTLAVPEKRGKIREARGGRAG